MKKAKGTAESSVLTVAEITSQYKDRMAHFISHHLDKGFELFAGPVFVGYREPFGWSVPYAHFLIIMVKKPKTPS